MKTKPAFWTKSSKRLQRLLTKLLWLSRLIEFIVLFSLQAIEKCCEKIRLKTHNGPRLQSKQSRSPLLALPAEIRLLIWNNVIEEYPVTVYRKDGSIGFTYLTASHHYPGYINNISPNILKQIRNTMKDLSHSDQACSLALLQTCQMM